LPMAFLKLSVNVSNIFYPIIYNYEILPYMHLKP